MSQHLVSVDTSSLLCYRVIFNFLWDHWAYCGVFENGVLLLYTLEGVSRVESHITAYESQ